MKDRPRVSTAKGPAAVPRPATLKRINMRRFLEELRSRGPSTRAELTRAIGVAPPTSSSIIAKLVETGWLEPAEVRTPGKGRPGQVYRLVTSSALVVGALIQIDECTVAPAGLDGIPRDNQAVRFKTPSTYEALLDALASSISRFSKPHDDGPDRRRGVKPRCLGVGLGIPGLVDENTGRVAFSPNLHFLDGRCLAPDLADRIGLQVVGVQEEHALCLAEQHLGGARRFADFAVLDVSAGMGMGVVNGKRYISGHNGFAGEIGHVTAQPDGRRCGCGNRGCLETVATDTALLNDVRERLKEDLDIEQLLARVSKGEIDISEELDRTLGFLAIGLAAITNLFNPEAIFIHGRLLELNEDVIPRLIAKTKSRSLRPSFEEVAIFRAQGNKLYGALAGLLDRVFAAVGPRLS